MSKREPSPRRELPRVFWYVVALALVSLLATVSAGVLYVSGQTSTLVALVWWNSFLVFGLSAATVIVTLNVFGYGDR